MELLHGFLKFLGMALLNFEIFVNFIATCFSLDITGDWQYTVAVWCSVNDSVVI